MFHSPLRYPGGKNKLAPFVAKICLDNCINEHYVEPYAGGASVALFLLFEGYVNRVTINDKDRSIYAFWYSVLNHTTQLCNLIDKTPINIENWIVQKDVQNNKETSNLLELGFSTLFLNRTNRSGIINGGMIGGRSQGGDFKIDCRFNKSEIIRRIKLVAQKRSKINLYNEDAINLINLLHSNNSSRTIYYFDPPYYVKGSSLYLNHYLKNDHKNVSDKIKQISNASWIISYDNEPEIKNLYLNFQKKEYCFNHSAFNPKEGQEILFFSPSIKKMELQDLNPVNFKKQKNKADIVYKIPRKRKQKS